MSPIEVLECCTSTLEPVDVVNVCYPKITVFICDRTTLRKSILLVECRTWAHGGTHLVECQSLADIVVASKCYVACDCRLVLIKSTAETLLSALGAHQLLLLLLLSEIELIDSAVTVL